MNYYTQTIPFTLAKKLKEKGMPMKRWQGWATPYISVMETSEYDWLDKEFGNEPSKVEKRYSVSSYAEVFDWLIEKRIYIGILVIDCMCDWTLKNLNTLDEKKRTFSCTCLSWHKAANAAIKKALELI